MFHKPRKTLELQMLEVLQTRSSLSTHQQATSYRLSNGYQGEVQFCKLLQEKLPIPHIPIFDLQLKVTGSECQLDCIVLFQNELYLFEIKNFQGDYYTENDKWYTVATKKEIKNPLHQLHRTDLLLREYLNKHNSQLTLKSYIVFMHAGFQLYQAPLGNPMIFPSQHDRFMKKLQHLPSQLDGMHNNLANQLKAAHVKQSTFEQFPSYNYSQLKKGITCGGCGEMMQPVRIRTFQCLVCKRVEDLDKAVMRSVSEFHLLFPNTPISVGELEKWCDYKISKASLRRILAQHLRSIKKGRKSHYVFDENE